MFALPAADELSSIPPMSGREKVTWLSGSPRVGVASQMANVIWPTLVEDHDAWQSDCTSITTPPDVDDHAYILATDADMEFTPQSVRSLLDLCESDLRIGGACGRTHPQGFRTNPLVWYQKFEYAKGECCALVYSSNGILNVTRCYLELVTLDLDLA